MAILVLDPMAESEIRAWKRFDRYDEVWEGVTVLSPLPNNEHQRLLNKLCGVLEVVIGDAGRGIVYPGVNVSDRAEGWMQNYRCPDVAVYLTSNPAVDRETYMQGGPDFAVEIVSPGEDPLAKLDFYASVNTRELLIVRRVPAWSLELYRLIGGRLESAGVVDLDTLPVLTSETLELTLRLVPGQTRPQVEVMDMASRQTWLA